MPAIMRANASFNSGINQFPVGAAEPASSVRNFAVPLPSPYMNQYPQLPSGKFAGAAKVIPRESEALGSKIQLHRLPITINGIKLHQPAVTRHKIQLHALPTSKSNIQLHRLPAPTRRVQPRDTADSELDCDYDCGAQYGRPLTQVEALACVLLAFAAVLILYGIAKCLTRPRGNDEARLEQAIELARLDEWGRYVEVQVPEGVRVRGSRGDSMHSGSDTTSSEDQEDMAVLLKDFHANGHGLDVSVVEDADGES